MTSRNILNSIALTGVLAITACANTTTGTASATTTDDGLVLQETTSFDELYLRPGANLQNFASYGLEPCEVSFRKNWLRDQNQQRVDVSNRVTQKNADEISRSLSEQCGKYLREALDETPTLNVVDNLVNTSEGGQNVLVLRPSVVDLDINAPETDGPGIVRNYTRSFGEMTLVLELADATTGEVLARAVEKRRGPDRAFLQRSNTLTNKAETDRILRRWSEQVRASLDSGLTSS